MDRQQKCRPAWQQQATGGTLGEETNQRPTTTATTPLAGQHPRCDASLSTVPRRPAGVKTPVRLRPTQPPLCLVCHAPLAKPYGCFWMPVRLGTGGCVVVDPILLHRECCELAYHMIGDAEIPTVGMEAGA